MQVFNQDPNVNTPFGGFVLNILRVIEHFCPHISAAEATCATPFYVEEIWPNKDYRDGLKML
jgi:hypothetical protein